MKNHLLVIGRSRWTGLLLCVALGSVSACTGSGGGSEPQAQPESSAKVTPSPALSSSPTVKVSVTSTLDGRQVLPTRLAWVTHPKVVGDDVANVDYLIDNQLAWREDHPPYAFGSEGNVLVTTFLKPGVHTFTTRVVTVSGVKAADTVRARVQPAPSIPVGLKGVTWSRRISVSDGFSGRWTLTAKDFGWLFGDPLGGGANQDVSYRSPGHVTLHAYIEEPPFGGYERGGGFCEPPDPTATYAYTISPDGSSLHFKAASDEGCDGRRFLLEGRWQRVAGSK